jgi:hypothetical protein
MGLSFSIFISLTFRDKTESRRVLKDGVNFIFY